MPVQEPAATIAVPEDKVPEPVPVAMQPGSAKLQLNFLEQSWVSVNDRDGKEIFNKTQAAGNQAVVEGLPPFNIVIGNAKGVQLTYNDKPVDLALHAKANVARLTLE
jgi:cytoskeleton protein RodZ